MIGKLRMIVPHFDIYVCYLVPRVQFYLHLLRIFTPICARGLSTILSSGNITTYPTLCAKVTATFSVLSDTVNAVKTSLTEKHKRSDIAQAVGQLQKYEGEKLNLTAAMHLEKLRLKNEELGLSFDGSDQASSRLLKEGIHSLERKIMSNVVSINEVLDELRCISAEENEE